MTPRPLKIALVTKTFPPFSYGGTESYSQELASELAKQENIELHVLCFQSAEKPVSEKGIEAIRENLPYELHVVGSFYKGFRGLSSVMNYRKNHQALKRLLGELRPDVIQTVGVYSESILAMRLGRAMGIPGILFPRGSELNRDWGALRSWLYRSFVFGPADAVLFQTQTALELCRSSGLLGAEIPSRLLKVVPNGIDLLEMKARSSDRGDPGLGTTDEFIVLWVGRFEEVKRPQLAAEIFQDFRKKLDAGELGQSPLENKLVMVGDGTLYQNMERTQEIELKGRLERILTLHEMAKSDLLINTSRSEGFPQTFLEAMAHSLPILCFDVSANKGIVEDGVGGFVVAEGDRKTFVEKLLQLAGDPVLRQKMGEHNKELVTRYSWDNILWEMLEVYRDLAAGGVGAEKR